MIEEKKSYYCETCNRTMDESNFYTSKNLEKYPNDGKFNQCKKCMTMHVNNFDPETFTWILKEVDVPYVPDEWNKLLLKYGKNKEKLTGMTILGRYLSTMKLRQWKDYTWADNEHIQEVANAKMKQAMTHQGYAPGEIAMAIEKANCAMPPPDVQRPPVPQDEEQFMEDYFDNGSSEIDLDLTEEDKTYLRLKWGKSYRPEEWVKLEQLYEEMMGSYDIQTAGHIDTLKLVCKTSLKANQLLDLGDVDGAQKMVKMYDGLMKSGKFTAAQNKAENGEYVDSISEIVAICEKDGFIPRFYTDGPQDKADRVLQDFQTYTRNLVTEEMNLGNLIENAIKQIELDKEKEAIEDSEAATEDEILENQLFEEDAAEFLRDEDFEKFKEVELENEEADDEFLQSLLDDGEVY